VNHDFLDPPWDETKVVLVDSATIKKAVKYIVGCEACSPRDAEIRFDNILDHLTGHNPRNTDYVFDKPGKCPRCMGPVTEKTLIELAADPE
jgi:hypothetical protein